MLFNTFEFILFLPIVIVGYYLTPHKFRWILLLLASYYFYMCWNPIYVLLIFTSTLIDYFCGIQMEQTQIRSRKKVLLALSLFSNLGLLFFFKYYNFVSENLNEFATSLGFVGKAPILDLLLPVGISFYTFQTLSYSIDVYNGTQKAEKHLGYFALYVSFFPQLVAGPIERFSSLTPQFKEEKSLTYENLANGFRLIIYGLFVKMVIADNLAPIIDKVYEAPEQYSSIDILTTIFLYSFQIYGDFYGYSLVAIGSALLLGIKLMDNFKTPYLSTNIAEFWQRWHISLSTWFRDYLYYPMGGNRVSKKKWILNIATVFIVSGVWHGANWNFIIWGALFGLFYIIENATTLKAKTNYTSFSFTHIFLALKTYVLISFIWVFFRSSTFVDAVNIFKLIVRNSNNNLSPLLFPTSTIFFLLLFLASDFQFYNQRFDTWVEKRPLVIRWSTYFFLIFGVIVFSSVDEFSFIYFQF